MIIFYTGVDKFLDPQPSPNQSLGGLVSSTDIMNGSINNLFSSISELSIKNLDRQVRGVALQNTTAATISVSKLYHDVVSSDPISSYRMAIVSLVQSDCGDWYMDKIPNETALPFGVTFITNIGEANALDLPDIPAGGYIGIWIERTLSSTKIKSDRTCENLFTKHKLVGVSEITTIETVADVTDSLNDTNFKLETVTSKYVFWYDTGVATIPDEYGYEPIRVQISTDATDIDVAIATETAINTIIVPKGELTVSLDTATLTITNSEIGNVNSPVDNGTGFTFTTVTEGISGGTETEEEIEMTVSW